MPDKKDAEQQRKIEKQKELIAKMDWSVEKPAESPGGCLKPFIITVLVLFVGFFLVCAGTLSEIGS